MKPYYETDLGKLYHGDCREIMLELEVAETIITDPVWPKAKVEIAGRENPEKLFAEFCSCIKPETSRVIIQIGCDTDPRFLKHIPGFLPFLRVCWLDYARPSYKGRLLYTGDVAHAFGIPPAYIKGRQVMSGMCRSTKSDKLFHRGTANKKGKDFDRNGYDNLPHPMPRRLQHVKWLVHQFSDEMVLDPFMGSGTTAIACEEYGRKWIGIELEEKFCEFASGRIENERKQLKLF